MHLFKRPIKLIMKDKTLEKKHWMFSTDNFSSLSCFHQIGVLCSVTEVLLICFCFCNLTERMDLPFNLTFAFTLFNYK